MEEKEFPLIISPNLGCPKIVSVKELINEKVPIDIIIAGRYGEFKQPTIDIFQDEFNLVPSFPEDFPTDKKSIGLEVIDIKELTGWSRLFDFSSPEETQLLISSEFHYNVMGMGTKYWLLKARPKKDVVLDQKTFLRSNDHGKWIPALYDLIFSDKSNNKKINYHAIQFVETFEKELNFIHLTDLHVAQRNDDILGEVLKKWEKGMRSRKEITDNFINFNDNLRRFIHIANEMVYRGELDFIIITGDIVDFSGNGWDESINPAENSWRVFSDIITGHGTEGKRGFRLQKDAPEECNHGIRSAIFTSAGNHDYRLHPYSISDIPGQSGKFKEYGLTEEEAKIFNYKSFDSSEYPDDKRKVLSDALTKESLDKLNLDALEDKSSIRIAKWTGQLEVYLKGETGIITALLGAGGATMVKGLEWLWILIGAAVPFAVITFAKSKLKKMADFFVDLPIHAEVRSLHYYFMHINPYFDYAFSIGNNHFVLMDTGADVAAIVYNDVIDGVTPEFLKKVSIRDTLGSSPDSMAFDPRQAYYNWEQIVWLDKVLSAISSKRRSSGKGRTFIGVHAPPLNYDMCDPKCNMDNLRESKTGTFISKDCNLTYGTINHYLSQFFFLCSGKRENPHRKIKPDADTDLEKVDLVFSGHAHIDVEFRVEIKYDEAEMENKIRFYHDAYSERISEFDEKRPIIVQTASCGPPSAKDTNAPNWRVVKVNKQNEITGFEQVNLPKYLKK